MANRVLLDTSGLLVSQSGVNVLTATEQQLLFSSQWSQISLLMKGSVTAADNTTITVPFGKTYTNRPLVCIRHSNGTQNMNASCIYTPFTNGLHYATETIAIFADRFEFWVAIGFPAATIDYVIWDFDL